MKYTLPKAKPGKKNALGAGIESPDEYDRNVRIPANDELLKELPVGANVTITLVGKVSEAEAKGEYSSASIRIKVSSVETDSKNEFEELAED